MIDLKILELNELSDFYDKYKDHQLIVNSYQKNRFNFYLKDRDIYISINFFNVSEIEIDFSDLTLAKFVNKEDFISDDTYVRISSFEDNHDLNVNEKIDKLNELNQEIKKINNILLTLSKDIAKIDLICYITNSSYDILSSYIDSKELIEFVTLNLQSKIANLNKQINTLIKEVAKDV